jgi:hypothetical protein
MKAFQMMIDLLIKGSVQLSPRKINGHIDHQQAFANSTSLRLVRYERMGL